MCRPITFTEQRNIFWSILNAVGLLLLIIAVVLLAVCDTQVAYIRVCMSMLPNIELWCACRLPEQRLFQISLIKDHKGITETRNAEYYTAVVVESVPLSSSNSTAEKLLYNIFRCADVIENSAQHSPDIIVFPECALVGCPHNISRDTLIRDFATVVPSPEAHIKPCQMTNYSAVLSAMSCAAEIHGVYVVVNLYEKVICSQNVWDVCPENETLVFNTNVAFDRNGEVIARYRKFNLYNERSTLGINSTRKPELSTFITDFGVTFGMIICFDILFKQPSSDLIKTMNVTDMIFSGAVYTEFPFLALTSLGAGWSYSMNTKLLLSDTSTTRGGIGGSGIYVGRNDPLLILMQEHNDTRYLMAKVPIKPLDSDLSCVHDSIKEENLIISVDSDNSSLVSSNNSNLEGNSKIYPFKHSKFLIDTSIQNFTIQNLTQNMTDVNELQSNSFFYSNEKFTCKIEIVWYSKHSSNLYDYKLAAYSGNRNFSTASVNNHVAVCGLMLCAGENNTDNCILPPDLLINYELKILSINLFVALASNGTETVVIPSTLNSYLYPLKTSLFTFENYLLNTGGNKTLNIINMNLIQPVSNLVTFAVYSLPERSTPDPQNEYYYEK